MFQFFEDLSVRQKIALIIIILAIPVVAAAFTLVRRVSEETDIARKELVGIEYLTSIRDLMEDVALHRGTVNAMLNNDASARERLPSLKNEVDWEITELEAKDAKLGR